MTFWRSKRDAPPPTATLNPIRSEEDWSRALEGDRFVVYKHSPACWLSQHAIREMQGFADRHPDVPVHIVDVIRERDLSWDVAEQTGVVHESPQVIVFEDGDPVWNGSHGHVKRRILDDVIQTLDSRRND